MRRLSFALVGAMLLGSAVLAQLKVDVALVNVVATVTDDRGQYVPDLTADDFIVTEDGQTQTISHLTQSNDLPVSVGVVLDTSGSMERKIGTATNAVDRFFRTIHEDDDIFLMTFSDRPILRQDFTSDRTKLTSALRRVTVGGGTALYDALDDGLRKIKNGEHEKKAILLITDGEDTSSMLTFDQANLSVRESEMLVYCIGIAPAGGPLTEGNPTGGGSTPPTFPGGGGNPPTGGGGRTGRGGRGSGGGTINIPLPGGGSIPFPLPRPRPFAFQVQTQTRGPINRDSVDMTVLNSFADNSGGKAWLLSGSWTEGRGNQVESILDEIAAELRSQYSIGYYPTHPLQDGKWHRIEIRARNPKYHVRARKEYFGK
jgi:VWFA-related protein